MSLSSRRAVLQLWAFVILLASIAVLAISSLKMKSSPTMWLVAIFITASTLNVAVLFSWLVIGRGGGSIFLLLAVVAMLFVHRAVDRSCAMLIWPLVPTGAIGWLYLHRLTDRENYYDLRAERIEEEINLLLDELKRRRFEIDSLRKKIERYSALKEVAEVISTTLSPERINSFVMDSAMRIVGKAKRALLFLVDREKQELALLASRAMDEPAKIKEKKGDIFDNWVLKQRKPLIIEDIDKDFRFSQGALSEARQYFRSLISAPLVMEGKVTGILRLDSPLPLSCNQEDLRLLDVIADLAAVGMENARLYKTTEELAIRDGLTDLVVSRYFKERLREEAMRAARSKTTFSLLMVDIDYFKEYNDRYGHIAGDIVLRYLAAILKRASRDGDVVARYGGEEFTLILLGRGKESALKEAEAIRKKIESEPLILRRQKTKLTVSIGVANLPDDSLMPDDLIRRADENLYEAKRKGRNRVVG